MLSNVKNQPNKQHINKNKQINNVNEDMSEEVNKPCIICLLMFPRHIIQTFIFQASIPSLVNQIDIFAS